MLLHLRFEGRRGLARQAYRQLRAAIDDGTLAAGERLPSSRELARQLDVSRNTIAAAYDWLLGDGLIEGRAGAGSFVRRGGRAPGAADPPRRGAPIRLRAFFRDPPAPLARPRPAAYDFRVGLPDMRPFPRDVWRRALTRQLRRDAITAEHGDPAGDPRLRRAIARHVAAGRGVRAAADDIVVVNGAQQAFAFVATVLLEPGDRVAVEEPGYLPARRAFAAASARVAGVAVDAEGIVVAALPDDARLVYVTPSHQFPTGVTMSHARRLELLAWAERRGAVVVEDDYDSEFRFGDRPLDTLHGLDRAGRVVYVGSFSKTMTPALRMGFMVAPAPMRAALLSARAVMDWHPSEPTQAALAEFMEVGALARHIRKTRRLYAQRHAAIARAVAGDFAPWLSLVPSSVGLHLAAHLTSGGIEAEAAIIAAARVRDVALQPLSPFHAGPGARAGLVIGYGGIDLAALPEGLRRLRDAVSTALGSPAGRTRGRRQI